MKHLNTETIEELKLLAQQTGPELLHKLVNMFVDTVPDALGKLRQLHNSEELQNLSREAHRLKSSCSSLGATRMGELCHQIERDALEPTSGSNLGSLISELEHLYPEVTSELRSLL